MFLEFSGSCAERNFVSSSLTLKTKKVQADGKEKGLRKALLCFHNPCIRPKPGSNFALWQMPACPCSGIHRPTSRKWTYLWRTEWCASTTTHAGFVHCSRHCSFMRTPSPKRVPEWSRTPTEKCPNYSNTRLHPHTRHNLFCRTKLEKVWLQT